MLLLYGDIQHNTDNTQNVAPYWNGERKKRISRICNFLYSMETGKAIQAIDKILCCTFELRKRRNAESYKSFKIKP